MTWLELQSHIRELSRREKFLLIEQLLRELSKEEQVLEEHFLPGATHGVWSQTDAFEAAAGLVAFLESQK